MEHSADTRRIVVTGGAGFIGSHLVDQLIDRGHEVHVVDNLATGRRDRINPAATFHELDVADAHALVQLTEQHGPFTTWFHLAAQADVRVSVDDPLADARVNVLGTVSVLEAARRTDANVVFASTGGAIYGDAAIPTDESAREQPESPYGTAKLAAEKYVETWARLYAAPHAIVRYANVYGPRQDPHGEAGVVAIFGGRILDGADVCIYGDGTQTRDYVFVDDVVATTISAGEHALQRARSQWRDVPVFNVGTGTETSVLQLWDSMQQAAGSSCSHRFEPARPGELARSALDASRARTTLSMGIDTPLLTGLEHTLAWMRAARQPVQ